MRYLSMFSGIEAASVAWRPLGWEAAAFCEFEAFPSAVLAHHYPHVPNLGDVTKADFDAIGTIDLAVFGSPCQSFSVAGKRLGLDDPRGNLALLAGRVVHRKRARWFVFENVPGLLSSDDGWDFGTLLAAFAGYPSGSVFAPPADGWGGAGVVVQASPEGYGLAWRVLDAQYFGVAQRRRRVFVVGHLGDWRRAAAVLFERHSLQGHPAPSREAREGVAPTISARPTGGGGLGTDFDCDGGLIAFNGRMDPVHGAVTGALDTDPLTQCVAFSSKDHGADAEVDLAPTLRAGGHDGSHANAGVPPAIAFALRGREGGAMPEMGGDSAGALRAASGGSSRDYVTFDTTQVTSVANRSAPRLGDPCHPLAAGAHPPAIAGTVRSHTRPGSNEVGSIVASSAVRRLTPRECERLQGFPEIENTLRILVCRSEEEKRARARFAQQSSPALALDESAPVAVHALIDLERQVLRLHSLGRSPWSASIAELASSSRLPMPADAFARLAAHTNDAVARSVRTGVAASPASIKPSSGALNGSASAVLCGRDIAALANDAERFTAALSECSRSITSQHGQSGPTCASTLETLACCVAHAMTGFIPAAMRDACSYELRLTAHQGYTAIPWRKGMAPDGPRYKALGNSMAVPCMAWLGRRIEAVEALEAERSAA